MDKDNEKSASNGDVAQLNESSRPLAFTIDFGGGAKVDTERHKSLVEKYQKRHRRGQSLSKLEDSSPNPSDKKPPSTGNLPRKASLQSEGYFSSDERSDRNKMVRPSSAKRSDLSLPLRSVISDKMTQSFPSANLPSITSPELELKDVSSPELDLISPWSPKPRLQTKELPPTSPKATAAKLLRQYSSPCESHNKSSEVIDENNFVEATEFDFDKSDTVSDAGTYTLEADNYSEEQKERMSIDCQFRIEKVSMLQKAEDYVQSIKNYKERMKRNSTGRASLPRERSDVSKRIQKLNFSEKELSTPKIKSPDLLQSPLSPTLVGKFTITQKSGIAKIATKLSPILSPTQNMSIVQTTEEESNDKQMNNDSCDPSTKTFTKIMFPSPKAKNANGLEQLVDQGSVISVTSSGAFRPKNDKETEVKRARKLSLTQTEVQVEAYVDSNPVKTSDEIIQAAITVSRSIPKLTANIVNVQNISIVHKDANDKEDEVFESSGIITGNLVLGKVSNLPPAVGGHSGKTSPTKIPSPIHTSRPRSRSSVSSLNVDLSDSSLETESYLKPTVNMINSLQQRLSLDSDADSDYDGRYLNNSAHNLLKQKATHIRHNSLDDRNIKISNKLEHFQNKNLQGIDQTYSNVLNQYNQNKVVNKIQNSPNNSPIRRSSSFSTKNQINNLPKNTNVIKKESNIRNSPNLNLTGSSIQRSASTASIKPQYMQLRRSSISSDQQKNDRNFGDTESSSEEDFEKKKKKDLSLLTNTRYNRAFSLRRARLDNEQTPPKCPNTPEMRRKFQSDNIRSERAISVDRKPMKTNDIQSRYMLNITKRSTPPPKSEPVRTVPKLPPNKTISNKPQIFARTDSGRFSMRTTKPPTSAGQRSSKKDSNGKKSGGRSNSSLSSREVEFQNWKRRKSYDPMKAAAEGKRKEIAKKHGIGIMAQSYIEANQGQDCDSSPSHSSSVHRSQSFHGTAALEQLISSEEEEDLTLSADEGFSPPTPSPCELSPARASLRNAFRELHLHSEL